MQSHKNGVLFIFFFMGIIFAQEEQTSDAQEREGVVEIIKQDKQALESMRIIIDALLNQIHDLIVFINSSPEISRKIEDWAESKNITHWPEDARWDTFNKDLQTLVNKLTLAKEQNVETKDYRYLAYILEKVELSDKLEQTQKSLNEKIPLVIGSREVKGKMNEVTKKALQESISELAEILYVNSVSNQLEEIFKTYESTAEKLRSEAQAAQKKALGEKTEKEAT